MSRLELSPNSPPEAFRPLNLLTHTSQLELRSGLVLLFPLCRKCFPHTLKYPLSMAIGYEIRNFIGLH